MYVQFRVDEAKIEFYTADSELSTRNKEKLKKEDFRIFIVNT